MINGAVVHVLPADRDGPDRDGPVQGEVLCPVAEHGVQVDREGTLQGGGVVLCLVAEHGVQTDWEGTLQGGGVVLCLVAEHGVQVDRRTRRGRSRLRVHLLLFY
eukprot:TRINITY_DN367_c0_g1_i8.p3 TRINITY_DN367_c0_g1~~TRINITY_DN367_c0_g1_i8.p3  ORF type:complete len:104 (-),score=14.30 TRINITY_DN367_c0_g1_i8:47-358(-)